MIDRNTPPSGDEPDTSWIWIGGTLAAVFLVLGLFAIFWGGNMPVTSARLSPVTGAPVTPHTITAPEPAPSTTGQGAR
jgi:hypothetical protein